MAFRATNIIPEDGYRRARSLATQTRSYVISLSSQFQSDTNADAVLGAYHDLRRTRGELDLIKIIPGIAAYAQLQEDDPTYDVASEFSAFISAISAVMTNIETTFPVDAGGFLLEKKLNAQGTYDFRRFTAAQLATLRGLLDVVAASVS